MKPQTLLKSLQPTAKCGLGHAGNILSVAHAKHKVHTNRVDIDIAGVSPSRGRLSFKDAEQLYIEAINPHIKIMKTNAFSKAALAASFIVMTMLTGCASLPKTDLAASNRQKLHSIAVLDVSEPHAEGVVNFGGAAGAFGLVGALVQGGVNQSHTTTYTQRVASEKIVFAPVLGDGLTTRLSDGGYQVVALHDQKVKLTSDGKSDDYSGIKTDADGILAVWITSFGYVSPPSTSDFIPWVVIRARLLDGKSKQDIYFKTFACGWDIKANTVHIDADVKYRYDSFSTLTDQFDQSVTGLKDCEQAIVAAIGQDLTKPL